MKYLVLFLITICSLSNIYQCSYSRNQFKSKSRNNSNFKLKFHNKNQHKSTSLFNSLITNSNKNNNKRKLLNINFPKNTINFFQSWAKFYHSNTSEVTSLPFNFFKNNDFYNQIYPKNFISKKDEKGSLVIPSQYSYYLVVYKNSVNFYSSRDKIYRKSTDSFHIDSIKPIPEDRFMSSSVKDLKKLGAGYCISISLKIPKSYNQDISDMVNYNQVWYICLKTADLKDELLSTLIKLKISKQRENGNYLTVEDIDKDNKDDDLKDDSITNSKNNNNNKNKNNNKQDGIMQLLQNWSDCSLKCGGGVSYQQWMCIPPKNGGKPCKGKLIRKKSCNEDPCPDIKQLEDMSKSQNKEKNKNIKKPIVKIARYSKRFNRYSKCLIKETDIFRDEKDEETNTSNLLPSRILMNNSTITVFKNDDYNKLEYSFNLDKTNFIKDKQFCCFSLQDNLKSKRLCGFPQTCGNPDNNKFVNEWQSAFNLFKVECNTGKQTGMITTEEEEDLKKSAKRKANMLALETSIENNNKKAEENSFIKKVNSIKSTDTQLEGLKALEKETDIESMIKNEEKEKEEIELQELESQITKEANKGKCLESNIKEKEIDQLFQQDEKEADQEVYELKKQLTNKVLDQRKKLKKDLEKMKQKNKMKKAQLQSKLKAMKFKMTKKILQAQKIGKVDKCVSSYKDEAFRNIYCDKVYVDDYMNNQECKIEERFCNICCESEFGDLHLDKRNQCYDLCDNVEENKTTK